MVPQHLFDSMLLAPEVKIAEFYSQSLLSIFDDSFFSLLLSFRCILQTINTYLIIFANIFYFQIFHTQFKNFLKQSLIATWVAYVFDFSIILFFIVVIYIVIISSSSFSLSAPG
jgi:hypothetical protein